MAGGRSAGAGGRQGAIAGLNPLDAAALATRQVEQIARAQPRVGVRQPAGQTEPICPRARLSAASSVSSPP